QRVTGQSTATGVSVQVNLVMTDQALFGVGTSPEEPATLIGGGTIPAALARRLLADASGEAGVFIRRLYTHPTTGRLAAMDSQSRCFTANQRHFLLLRDQSCRTPWCDAPIRHADHIAPVEDHGQTTIENGQGLCEACNYTKTAPGWRQHHNHVTDEIITTTPTGHVYRSRAPGLPNAHVAA
ncbi:MAG: HNH endonuclease, partial [Actinomycetota bacterium]|nr:HNH endonuclease [Actinomycetota bacterium]